MPVEIIVPPLSQTMDSLILVSWLKQPGEMVVKGEPLFSVETDKATLEVESPASGQLQDINAQPGDEIRVRSVIGRIVENVGQVSADLVRSPTTESDPNAGQFPPDSVKVPAIPETASPRHRLFATPRARLTAQNSGISLEVLRNHGTGPHGWIVARDVEALTAQGQAHSDQVKATPLARRIAQDAGIDLSTLTPGKPGEPLRKADVEAVIHLAAVQRTPLSPTRRTIARRLSESHASVVPVTYMTEVDATRLVRLRKRILEELPADEVRPTITDFLVWITCRALRQYPEMNAIFDGEVMAIHPSVHMGLAVDTDRGLLVPVIRDANEQGVLELAHSRQEIVRRTQSGQMNPDELSGGTFTLTNLGTLGIDHFTPVINPPQVAILGVGRIRPTPFARKKKIKVRQVLGLALTCDHRVIDGAPAARFLQAVTAEIEKPYLAFSK